MKKNIFSALLFFASFFVVDAFGQNVQVSAKMDSTNIMIGEQTHIKLELTQDKNATVFLPHINDTIIKGIEVLEISKPDTSFISDNRITITQDLLITSFDSALYYIPPFKYVAGEDTIYTNALALNVQTFEIDPESKDLFDIKGVKTPPFVFKDYLGYILTVLLIIVLLIAAYWLYKRYKNKERGIDSQIPEEELLPPAIAARKAIEELKDKKLWQNGFEKEYYSSLTDIIRVYIERRYSVNAMEQTSAEILDSLKPLNIDKKAISILKDLFQTSDFVKFAKLKPGYDENEASVKIAESFIDETEEKCVETDDKEVISNETEVSVVEKPVAEVKKNDDSEHDKYMPKG